MPGKERMDGTLEDVMVTDQGMNDRSDEQDQVMKDIFGKPDEEDNDELAPIGGVRVGHGRDGSVDGPIVRSFFSSASHAVGDPQRDIGRSEAKGPNIAEGETMDLKRDEQKELDRLYESVGSAQVSRKNM